MSTRQRTPILVLPRTSLYRKLFTTAADERLRGLGIARFNETESEWNTDQLAQWIGGTEVLVTGWGSPKLTRAVLDRAPDLKLIVHSAGSVKFMMDEQVFDRGIRVTSVGAAMVNPVSELTVMLCMLMLRPVHKLDAALRNGQSWAELKIVGVGDELSSQTVGVIGAGQIGRRVIQLLRAWDIKVNVFDPFYSAEQAAAVGVRKCASISQLMNESRVVTLHAPILPETRHMIGREQLAAMRDGGVLINTARAWLVDMEALAAEVRSRRITCATDVYDTEPLPLEDPWRQMPNTLITPHIASYTHQAFHRQGDFAVDEVERYVTGQPLAYEVKREMLATMA
jgi:phosphoglycerate dehydrogenase-like enzyme